MYDCTRNYINGEWGVHGIEDFLELKSVMGAA